MPNTATMVCIAMFAICSAARAADLCPLSLPEPKPPHPAPRTPYPYPMVSDRYLVEYQVGTDRWKSATVHVSYYGATNASPYVLASNYPADTSMSFVSIPAAAGKQVSLRVTKT